MDPAEHLPWPKMTVRKKKNKRWKHSEFPQLHGRQRCFLKWKQYSLGNNSQGLFPYKKAVRFSNRNQMHN